MLDVGWTELVVIAIVLIIVVGPKDLPPMLRTFGRMMTKMRGMAGEFRQQFDEALKEADLDDVRKTISDAQKLNPAHSLREAMNPLRQMGNEIKADLQKATAVDPKPQVTPAQSTPENAIVPEPVSPAPVTSPVAVSEPVKRKRTPKAKAVAEPEAKVANTRKPAVKSAGAPEKAPKTKKASARNSKTGEA